MNIDQEDLLAYLLGLLDDDGRRSVELQLAADAQCQHCLGQLGRALEPLEHDGQCVEPEPTLAARTFAQVRLLVVAEFESRPDEA